MPNSPSSNSSPTYEEKSPSRVEKSEPDSEDAVSATIGDFGRWQLRLTFLLAFFNLPCTWHIMAITFQSRELPYWCSEAGTTETDPYAVWTDDEPLLAHYNNQTNHTDHCQVWSNTTGSDPELQPCHSWEFNHTDGNTIISEWDLVCGRTELTNVAEMSFLTGVALGGLISGMISDRFGRKKTLMLSLFIQLITGVSIAFTPWLELYMALRLILGFVSVSVVFSGFVLCMEIVGGKWRTISGVSFLFPVPLGYMTISGIAYLVRKWRFLQLAITLPGMLFFGLYWVLPESPRWLLATKRHKELLQVLRKGAAVNNRPLPENPEKVMAQFPPCNGDTSPTKSADGSTTDTPQHLHDSSKQEEESRPGFLDLFRNAHIRYISLFLYVIWFSLYLVYYGLMLNLSNIGNIYTNTVLAGAVEIPAIGLSILLLLKSGRKIPLCASFVGSGLACLFCVAVPLDDESIQWIVLTLTMIAKFSISCSNAMVPVFTAELFPTVVRNLGVGSSNMAAGIALMLVPYLWNLSTFWERLPLALLGSLGVIGGICVLFLPETAGKPLPETLAELEIRGDEEQREQRAELREKSIRDVPRAVSVGSYRRTMPPEKF